MSVDIDGINNIIFVWIISIQKKSDSLAEIGVVRYTLGQNSNEWRVIYKPLILIKLMMKV